MIGNLCITYNFARSAAVFFKLTTVSASPTFTFVGDFLVN